MDSLKKIRLVRKCVEIAGVVINYLLNQAFGIKPIQRDNDLLKYRNTSSKEDGINRN